MFSYLLAGLPFSEFLYEADQNRIDQLIKDIMDITDKIETKEINNQKASDNSYYYKICEKIEKYIEISKYTRRNNYKIMITLI